MSRELPSGTPTRSPGYLFPGSSRRLLLLSIAAGAALFAGVVILYFIGFEQFASPGDLSTEHAPIDFNCIQCHTTGTGSGVVDLRCERCHDPGGSARLTNSAHVLFGSGDPVKADLAETVVCIQCHTDHRGREFRMRVVDDRECAACHEFSSLGRHPEFAVVKADITTGLGIKFDHDRHIVEAEKTTGKPCESCHEPTPDLSDFEPISFDDHCARCHVRDGFVTGTTDPISPELITLPDQVADPGIATKAAAQQAARGRVAFSNLAHRDAWVVYNALRLRRAVDPEGEAAERAALRAQLAFLEQQLRSEPFASVAQSDLERWATTLEEEIGELDTRLAQQAAAGDDARALRAMASAVQAVASAVTIVDPSAGDDAKALASDAAEPAPDDQASVDDDPDDAARFDARKQELLNLLDAVAARGDSALAERAAGLRSQVEGLSAGSDRGRPDPEALRQALRRLDEVLRSVRAVPDPEAGLDAARIRILQDLARQRVIGGLSPEEFEDRRRELLGILDALDRREDETLRRRVADLRQRVVALRPGSSGDDGLRRLRDQKTRTLERVRLELELKAAGETAAPAVAAPVRDRRAIEAALVRIRGRLAALEGGPRPGAPLDAAQREARIVALESLLVPCVKCHELSGPALAPVTVAEPVMVRSVFTHAPHVIQATCESCHADIARSGLATDVNVPGVANCQQCHRPSEARADCATCHVYHPPSVASFLRAL